MNPTATDAAADITSTDESGGFKTFVSEAFETLSSPKVKAVAGAAFGIGIAITLTVRKVASKFKGKGKGKGGSK